MKALKIVLRLLVLGAVVAAFWGVPFCWLALKPQDFVWAAVLTLVLGRFFCDTLCPLGILQSAVNFLFHPKAHVRRVCTRLPETKVQRIVRWSVVALVAALGVCGCLGLATAIFPISVFGRVVSVARLSGGEVPAEPLFAISAFAAFALVLVLAAIGKGRIWCNWICPFGTFFNLIARISPVKDKVGKGCGNCRRCLAAGVSCSQPKAEPTASGVAAPRREVLKGFAVLAAADKLTDGGYADVSLPGMPERKTPVLPPGAARRSVFALKCVSCQLCVANCPGKCLRPSLRLDAFGQPEMDFRHGYCLSTCVKCGEVCPHGAIAPLQDVQRRHVHVGQAVWSRDLCIRNTEKGTCTACLRKCPVQAIHDVKGVIVVDADACIGCGACEHVCPSRPLPAIVVEGLEVPRVVNPVGDGVVRIEAADPVGDRFACVKPGNF